MKKLVYIDAFRKSNSNFHWTEIFKKYFDEVHTVNIDVLIEKCQVYQMVAKHQPDMVHFGGSCKLEDHVQLEVIKKIKEITPRVTSFYGDRYYLTYVQERAKIIDASYVTNAALINNDKMQYHPCPIEINWCKDEIEPIYDLVFIGNAYPAYQTRINFISQLAKKYKVAVWGGGDWKKISNIIYNGFCSVDCAPLNYQYGKIVLDDPVNDECTYNNCGHKCFYNHTAPRFKFVCKNIECPDFKPTYKYFSNRIPIAMTSNRPVLAASRNGMSKVIQNVEYYDYKDMKGIEDKIDFLLNNPLYRNELAHNAFEEVKDWTFDSLAQRLIG